MHKNSRLIGLPWCLIAAAFSAGALAEDRPEHLDATRIEAPPVIDGKLDEAFWTSVASITDLRQIRPGDGTPASEATDVRVAYDKDALYVGVHLFDRRGAKAITANNMRQGARLPDDDRISILIDPFGTGRGGYRFEVNLNAVRNDMLYQGGQPQGEWTVIWDAAARLTDDGWSTEIAIPFKTLPVDPNVKAWGFNVSRAIRGRGEEDIWVSRNRSWGPNITGELGGIHDVDQGLGLDVVPTLGLRQLRFFGASADTREANPSLDAYYRLTPSLSASFTVNTDFSATDTDDRQVNLTRFSLFFPEKRDFFLKDADLFDFGRIPQSGRPFFSRRLGLSPTGDPVDINFGGKISGRIGRWRVGMLAVRQDSFTSGTSRVNAALLGVARVSADVLGESSIGFIATTGNPSGNNDNSLVGADFLYLNSHVSGSRSVEGEAWVQKTTATGVSGDDAAFGLGARLVNTDGLHYGATIKQIGAGFRPALGFVSRYGVNDYNADIGYTRQVRGALVQSLGAGISANRIGTLGGTLQSQIVNLSLLDLETARRDKLHLYYVMNEERLTSPFVIFTNANRRVVIPVGQYEFNDYGVDFEPGQQRRLGVRLNLRGGNFYDGHRYFAASEVTWKQSRHLTLSAEYAFNDITLSTGKFSTRILSTGLDINFSSRLSWTNRLQYDNVSEIAGLQSHLHYIPKAGRELVLVVNHSSQDFDLDGRFRSLSAEYGARLSYTFRY
jgi:Carbohydrate family 9 binding domain-like/Domain of unknown function (DUF5916)